MHRTLLSWEVSTSPSLCWRPDTDPLWESAMDPDIVDV